MEWRPFGEGSAAATLIGNEAGAMIRDRSGGQQEGYVVAVAVPEERGVCRPSLEVARAGDRSSTISRVVADAMLLGMLHLR